MKKETTYAFITSKSWRFEVKAYNPKQAYKKALATYKPAEIDGETSGELTKSYYRYSQEGFTHIENVKHLD